MNKKEAYSRISNDFYYEVPNKENEELFKDDKFTKIMLIIHNLTVLTNREGIALTSIDYLIEKCGYSVTKHTEKLFKELLIEMKGKELIDFDNELKSYTSLIEINTENIEPKKGEGFFVIENEELDIIRSLVDNKREQNCLIRLYFYLKARVGKEKKDSKSTNISQTTYVSYENIESYTKLSQSKIKKYIETLKEGNLVEYKNLGIKVMNGKVSECNNLYALQKVSKTKERLDYDLKFGLKQQRFYYEEKGYEIVKKKVKKDTHN